MAAPMNQALEFFPDGADNLMNLQTYLNPLSKHYLAGTPVDRFYITIRSETGELQY